IEPPLPDTVADLGLQQELNLELIAMLQPELILISPFLAHLEPVLKRIGPTYNLSVYDPPHTPLATRIQVTRDLATRLGIPAAAERLVAQMQNLRAEAIRSLEGLTRKPLLFASFIDHRHARVYGGSSL